MAAGACARASSRTATEKTARTWGGGISWPLLGWALRRARCGLARCSVFACAHTAPHGRAACCVWHATREQSRPCGWQRPQASPSLQILWLTEIGRRSNFMPSFWIISFQVSLRPFLRMVHPTSAPARQMYAQLGQWWELRCWKYVALDSQFSSYRPFNSIKEFLILPLGRIPRSIHVSLKLQKNPVGKNLEKEYMIVVSCVALVASLKTSRDKLQENSWKKKEHNNVFRTNYNLQDYWFYDLLDLKSWIIQECSPPWTMHVSQMSHTNSSNVMTVSDLVNKSDIFLHGFICKMFISGFVLEFVRVEKFMCYVFSHIIFYIANLHLWNTCNIIFIDNGGGFGDIKTAWLPVNHSA
jgi:hypothetical protein